MRQGDEETRRRGGEEAKRGGVEEVRIRVDKKTTRR